VLTFLSLSTDAVPNAKALAASKHRINESGFATVISMIFYKGTRLKPKRSKMGIKTSDKTPGAPKKDSH
jgi:hypothetical protein